MKKILLATCVLTLALGTKTFAADTYTGALVDSLNQKINKAASPVVNKEKELQDKQRAIQNLQNQPIGIKQPAQLELINKKQQQIQTQKDLYNQQKKELKNLFSVE